MTGTISMLALAAAATASQTPATAASSTSVAGLPGDSLPKVPMVPISSLLTDKLAGPMPESQVTTYAGYYAANNGYRDRLVTGAFANWYLGETGLHADVLYINREQNAGYAALGVSHRFEGLGIVKLMAGTSTGNQDILPDTFLSAGLEVQPAKNLIVRPSVAYRHFRRGSSQINPTTQVAYYFGGGSAGYFVAQGDAELFFNNGGKTGWSLGAGLSSVRSNGLRFGFAAHRGFMAYDSILGSEVRATSYGGGPNIGYRFLSGHELFVRADYTHTRSYNVSGAIVGFKLPL